LSGEIKAAREAQSECKRALEDQERLVTIAVQAVVRADARVEELLAERAELAEDMAKAILQVGEAPVADEAAPAAEFAWEQGAALNNVFGNNHYANGIFDEGMTALVDSAQRATERASLNGIDRAYDEATQP
jgi:chorismate mutase